MQENRRKKTEAERAADIVRLAGGEIAGRTRFQKLAYLLEITGVVSGFGFEYRHYGPYSEELANATSAAKTIGTIVEVEHPTSWGGWYSTFSTQEKHFDAPQSVHTFVEVAAKANPVVLELAATAAFLALSGEADPWGETANRKPDKARWVESAKLLYERLKAHDLPRSLPSIH
jgi:hypothetical protein